MSLSGKESLVIASSRPRTSHAKLKRTATSEQARARSGLINEKDKQAAERPGFVREVGMRSKTSEGCVEHPNKLKLGRTKSTQFASSRSINVKTEARKKKYSLWTLIKLIASFNKAEWYWMVIGLTSSILAGEVQPMQAFSPLAIFHLRETTSYRGWASGHGCTS